MTSLNRKLQATLLAGAMLLPVTPAFSQVSWSKPDSRTKGTVIGAIAGGLIGGKKGAVIGAVVGNGVQYARERHDRQYRVRHVASYRHYRSRRHHRRR